MEVFNWISVKDRLPTEEDNDKNFLFVEFYKDWGIISNYSGKWGNVKKFRSYELKNAYTHYIPLPKQPKLSKEQ